MSKRLYRSRDNRMLSGVAGGLSEYFDVDPVIIRALFVITTIGGGTGLIAYIVLWIIVPQRPFKFKDNKHNNKERSNTTESKDNNSDTNEDNDNIYEVYSSDNEEYYTENKYKNTDNDGKNSKAIFGVILILLGGIFLLDNVLPVLDFDILWPILLVIFGGYILYQSITKKDKGEENENI